MKKWILLLTCIACVSVMTGCQANNATPDVESVTEDTEDLYDAWGNRIMTEEEKMESLREMDANNISFVTFGYNDEQDQAQFYWVDFLANKIRKNEQWYKVDEVKMKELQNYVCEYNPVIFSGTYAPSNDEESPEMESLFSYSVNVKESEDAAAQGVDYKVEGFKDYGYPEQWDAFLEQVKTALQDAEIVQ